ncbi:MAG: MOSC domain-containing protein [Arenibacterium sp.]
MTGTVSSLWRHPIKSHGREALDKVTFRQGETMPGDRVWAVAHEASKADDSAWSVCANFTRIAGSPALMAITSALDELSGRVTLRHPDRPDLDFDPETETQAYLDWIAPLLSGARAAPRRFVRVPGRGMTDSDFPSVTLCNMASHRAVEQRLGRPVSIHRWRGNLWFDGLPLWEEFDWMTRNVQIGEAIFRIQERTDRCIATSANPETGRRDADLLEVLHHWGHEDFSVRAEVIEGGTVSIGDEVRLL